MNKATRGFTLIELLVVITIIGILATWAVAIFSSQIQKSRDSTRINDINVIQAAVEQAYQDDANYPGTWSSLSWSLKKFIQRIPSDPKTWSTCWAWVTVTSCDYLYISAPDNWIAQSVFEVSTWFENEANRTNKAAQAKDGWQDNNRFEAWMTLNTLVTAWTGAITRTWCTASVPNTSMTKISYNWCN